jgi:transposase InsO family protein
VKRASTLFSLALAPFRVKLKENLLENFHNRPQTPALWRYGLISELLHGSSLGITLSERLKQAAERTWNHPQQGAIRITADTLRHWIYRYRKDGLKALDDRPRMDKGTSQVSKVIAQRLSALRIEHPHTTTETLLTMLLKEKVWNGVHPSRSSLYRLAINHGLKRKPLGAAVVQEAHAFAYESFGQLWVADFLHGPKVRVGRQLKKTYLLCILDDATRYVVFAAFFLSENTGVLIDGLSMAIRRFGVPEKFYTDNGAAFRSRHLALVAARLGMHLPHTPAYRPQGRGKVERFFRTVRDQCLSVFKSEAFESLQLAFTDWLDAYHHRIHDSLGCSPLSKRLGTHRVTKVFPDVAQIDLFFGMEERRKIQRNGTLHLLGKVFDVKNALPGTLVDVTYLPWDLSLIHVGPDKIPAKPIDFYKNAKRHEHGPIRGKELTP